MYYPVIFALGLFIGSFLGVVVERVPKGRSIVTPPSHCKRCKKTLKWYDNIPVISYVFMKGRCRFCKVRLSLFYPGIELLTAVMFVFATLYLSSNIYHLLFYLYIIASLIVIFFIDLKHEIIPSEIVYPAIIVTFLYIIINTKYLILSSFAAAIGALLFFLFIFLVTRGKGMGFGDVQFVFLMGLLLGFPAIIVALYMAFLTGGAVSLILILWRKKKLRGSTLPFGPFLVFGTFFALFFSKILVNFFLPGMF